ncbi:hypothetical protein [Singulisphaera sp. PoT]|uniref:hypothetical protein n=1 Tax=Singulisphaera sp. PoT TaxID=3411797 RepID=UPI003BF50DE2
MIMLARDHEGSDDSQTRRSMLGSLLHGLMFGKVASLREAAEPTTIFYDGDGLGLSGGYFALDFWPEGSWEALSDEERAEGLDHIPGVGWFGLRRAHRDEVLTPGPEPEPVSTEIIGEGRMACVARVWNPGDVSTCRRCMRCTAFASGRRPGFDACMVPLEDYDGPTVEAAPEPTPDPDPDADRIIARFRAFPHLVEVADCK